MGKKRNSKPNSTTEQADQASISTYDSPVTRATPPPPDSLSVAVESLRQKFTEIAKDLQNLTDKVTELDTKFESSTVTPNSSETMETKIRDISATQQSIVTDKISDIVEKLNYNTTATEKTRELFYNFKKDVKDYLGLDTPSRMNGSNLLSTDEDRNIPLSFRHVLEKITNPLDPIPNHHFQTFLTYYTKWQLYSGRGGTISLYGYIQTSPAVYDIYLAKARSQDPSFHFTKVHDNAFFFTQLIDFVFFSTGFDISAFEILVKEKRMKQFSIAAAGQYAFDVNVIVHALSNQIVSLNTSDLWRIVASYVAPHPFQKFIMTRVPPSSAKFLSYLDQFAKLYDQRAAMEYELRRTTSDDFSYQSDPSKSSQSYPSSPSTVLPPPQQHSSSRPQTYPPPPRKVNQLTQDSTYPLSWRQTDQCPIDQLCHNCMEVGLHLTANCPDLIPSSEQRNVNAVFTSTPSYSPDALRDFTSFDTDHTMEDNP